MNLTVALLIAAAVVLILIIVKYNGIITMRNARKQAFADIDAQLQLRFDLVPNLIETVKGYAAHEKSTLQNVVDARSRYMGAGSVDEKIEANNQLVGALKSIFALSENYPDLKASANFAQLQAELSDIENKLAASRRFFNSATAEYNTYIEIFPNNLIATVFGFKSEPTFEVENREEASKAPKVSF